jgi:hypothetical protein
VADWANKEVADNLAWRRRAEAAEADLARERAAREAALAMAAKVSKGHNLFYCKTCDLLVPRAEISQHEHELGGLRADRDAAVKRATDAEADAKRLREALGRILYAITPREDETPTEGWCWCGNCDSPLMECKCDWSRPLRDAVDEATFGPAAIAALEAGHGR